MRQIFFIVLSIFCLSLRAQIEFPPVSPYAEIKQNIGLTEIQINYSRPAVRGRKIIGGLVPYGRIWRVGANESTKFRISSDIKVSGMALKKGTYALYAFPNKTEWEIVFHRDTTLWGDGRDKYNPKKDALRIRLHPRETKAFQENFLITLDSITHNGAKMFWIWENTQISIPIEVPTDSILLRQMEEVMKGEADAQTYYEAARYLVEQNREPALALEYVKKAIELNGETYFYFRIKSLAEASLGDFKSAIKSAQKSKKIANSLGKDEFVRLNETNIANWKKQL